MLEAKEYIDKTIVAIQEDAAGKKQRIPALRSVETDNGAAMMGPHHFWYTIFGRGPGKFPPPDAMVKFVEGNPDMLVDAQQTNKNITKYSLAYLMGRKIAKYGTDIFQGKKPGINLLGAMEKNLPELTRAVAKNEAVKILTFLKSEL